MSYNIDFKVKVEDIDRYVTVYDCDANITWNVEKIIMASTGLDWINMADNGYCADVIPYIESGLINLEKDPSMYKSYEIGAGWGTVEDTARFFKNILKEWDNFKRADPELASVARFWIC